MSKLGFHRSHGIADRLGEILQRCYRAGSPVALIMAVGQDVWPDVKKFSPLTTVIYRHQPVFRKEPVDNPPDQYVTSPIECAQKWYALIQPNWVLNKAHYYLPTNERNPNSAAQHEWCDVFDLEMMRLAEVDDFKLALHGDSAGTPEISDWRHYQLSLAWASAHGHILALHEYGLQYGTLKNSQPFLALRYRAVHEAVHAFAPNLKIAITEASAGSGFDGKVSVWLPDAQWYDSELMHDSYLIGAALYQLGGAENFFMILPALGDYISAHPTPPYEPPDHPQWRYTITLKDAQKIAHLETYLHSQQIDFIKEQITS